MRPCEGHSRKFSRTECNRDIFNWLILTSDPFLSLNAKKKPTKSKAFQPETLKLLLSSNPIDEEIENLISDVSDDEL